MAERKRHCGGCTVCCTVTAVPELRKPFGITCQFCTNHSCHIYPDRPASCRAFECAWLRGELPTWMRPDKVHVMVEGQPGIDTVLALAEPGHEDSWCTDKVEKALTKEYATRGIAVVSTGMKALIPNERTPESVMSDLTEYGKVTGVLK